MVRGWWLAFRSQIALPRTTIERHYSDFLSFANPVNTRLPALKNSPNETSKGNYTLSIQLHRPSLTVLDFCNLRAAHVSRLLWGSLISHQNDEFAHTYPLVDRSTLEEWRSGR